MSDAAGTDRAAVVLVNLGTPAAPTAAAVRRYLAEFLADPRVIELPRWLWWLVLHGVILRVRPARSARAYAEVWTPEGSPLLVYSKRLTAAVAGVLGPKAICRLAMRYGEPALPTVLRGLRDSGVTRIVVLPLYPQYSGTTTGSVFDALAAELARWRRVPALRFVDDYHAEPAFLDALADSVRAHRAAHGAGALLLFSFHGIPRRYVEAGDPYAMQCEATARGVAARLGLGASDWAIAFQSRVGREPWLEPYTDRFLAALPARGVRTVDVICPGFATDCLETLEEIALRNAHDFRAAGGERLAYVPALNDSPAHAALIAALARRAAADWFAMEGPA